MAVHPALRKRAYTKIPVEEETMFQRSAGEDPMNEFYRIYIPYSKEDVLTTIKQMTQPLRLSNQAYRKTVLSSYKDERDELCIAYAAGSMNGGGWEMLKAKIKSVNDTVVLEGEFIPLDHIKRGSQIFFIVTMLFAILFSEGEWLIFLEMMFIFILPLCLLYRHIPQIVRCDEGRQFVLDYLKNILRAEIIECGSEIKG